MISPILGSSLGVPASLSSSVAKAIERDIRNGTSKPGELIGTKDQLRERFGVSHGTVNEAVQLLRSRSLIDLRPGPKGGIFAAAPSPAARLGDLLLELQNGSGVVPDAFAVKDALDPWLAADAASNRAAADIRDLKQILLRMKRARGDQQLFGRANWDLHRRIAGITPNIVMRAIYVTVIDIIEKEVVGAQAPEAFNLERLAVHQKLVDAIASGDRDLAFKAGGDDHHLPIVHGVTRRPV